MYPQRDQILDGLERLSDWPGKPEYTPPKLNISHQIVHLLKEHASNAHMELDESDVNDSEDVSCVFILKMSHGL